MPEGKREILMDSFAGILHGSRARFAVRFDRLLVCVLVDYSPGTLPKLSVIRIANLSKDFGGNRVLKGINFELAWGEAACILGPSGAGKSTLLRCLNGLVRPTTGTISVAGMVVERKNLAAVRLRVGLIFQAYHLLNN
jgi:ABC-type multidrug transport system fused ATPase/permease subunit